MLNELALHKQTEVSGGTGIFRDVQESETQTATYCFYPNTVNDTGLDSHILCFVFLAS